MADQALEIKDFSGGMTDNYIGGPLNKYQTAKNLVIRSDRKLDSRPGAVVFDDVNPLLPFVVTQKRVDSCIRFKSVNIYQTARKLFYVNSGYQEIVGPSSASAFSASTVPFDQASYAEWNNHLLVTSDRRERPKFIYKDGSTLRLRNIGLPAVNTAGITFSASGANSRAYSFCYLYNYTIDGVDYLMRGPVTSLPYTGAIPNSITNLPVLTNGANDSYDTAVIKLEIYRTADTLDTFYKVGEVTNGTTSFSDTTIDADLDDGLLLYTDADDLDYTQPPECKYIVQLNGVVYYLNIKDSLGDIYPSRIVQAPAEQIYAANEGNTVDVDDDLTGGGVAGQNVVVFTADRAYRLEGTYDSTGKGGINKVEISRTAGCISHKSIVQTLEGCFFAAKDGFYFTDGYKVLRISEEIFNSYSSSTSTTAISKRISGCFDPFEKRIYWAASSASDKDDNDIIYVAHLLYGLRPDTPFNVWDGGYWPANFQPTALMHYDQQLIMGNNYGYILKLAQGQLNDKRVDTATAASNWVNLPVIYDMKSCAFDFGDVTNRKWVTRFIVYADSIAKVSFTILSNNDNTGVFKELAEVKSNSPILWGDNDVVWGDTSIRWNYLPIISGNRRFPRNNIRCSYKQIQITNAYTTIDESRISGNVDVNGTTNQVTLLTAGLTWDINSVEYYISFDNDDYATEYRVITRNSGTVLTVEDTTDSLPTLSGAQFKLRGYRKNEALRLLSYSLIYAPVSSTQTPFRADA